MDSPHAHGEGLSHMSRKQLQPSPPPSPSSSSTKTTQAIGIGLGLGLTPYMTLMIILLVMALGCCSLCIAIYLRRTTDHLFLDLEFRRAASSSSSRSSFHPPGRATAPTNPLPPHGPGSGLGPGLDPFTLSNFPLVRFSSLKRSGPMPPSECAVCLSEFGLSDSSGSGLGSGLGSGPGPGPGLLLRQLPVCKHVFHPWCISMWLESHTTCPICRDNLAARPAKWLAGWPPASSSSSSSLGFRNAEEGGVELVRHPEATSRH